MSTKPASRQTAIYRLEWVENFYWGFHGDGSEGHSQRRGARNYRKLGALLNQKKCMTDRNEWLDEPKYTDIVVLVSPIDWKEINP